MTSTIEMEAFEIEELRGRQAVLFLADYLKNNVNPDPLELHIRFQRAMDAIKKEMAENQQAANEVYKELCNLKGETTFNHQGFKVKPFTPKKAYVYSGETAKKISEYSSIMAEALAEVKALQNYAKETGRDVEVVEPEKKPSDKEFSLTLLAPKKKPE